MQKMKLLVMALLVIPAMLSAQKDFEGEIVYGIEYMSVPPEMQGMESMLPLEMTVYHKGAMIRSEQDSPSGKQVSIVDHNKPYAVVLID